MRISKADERIQNFIYDHWYKPFYARIRGIPSPGFCLFFTREDEQEVEARGDAESL